MPKLNCKLEVVTSQGFITLKSVSQIEIKSGWQFIGDTCKLVLGGLSDNLNNRFAVGDRVTVYLGYDGDLQKEFEGFITTISPNIPFTLTLVDYVYYLQRKQVGSENGKSGIAYKSITLANLIKSITAGVPEIVAEIGQIPDVTLSPFRIEKSNVAQVLEKLQKEYGFFSYFRGNRLIVNLAYAERFENRVVYSFQQNLCADNGLVYQTEENVKVNLEVVSLLPNNTNIKTSVGDKDGEKRTWFTRGITSEAALKKIGEEKISQFKYSGYRGYVTTKLLPFPKHTQTAVIKDSTNPDRAGTYYIDSVTTTVTPSNGVIRKVEIGRKAT